MLYAILIITSTVISLISLKYFSAPYIWIDLSWFIVFLCAAILSTKASTKAICFNIAVIPLTLGIYETYLWIDKEPGKIEEHIQYIQGAINKQHDFLGYAPVKNSKAVLSRFYDDKLIYSVVYTIDSNGLRISPPYKGENDMGSVLFFGGSFTFGEAVNDEETIPYWTGIKTHGKYPIYNFGFRGYGPHQMLSALEHGMVDTIIECKPKYAIYQAIYAHINRAAGFAAWDEHGPKYTIKKNGKITYSGNIDNDNLTIFKRKLRSQIKKSLIFRKIKILDRYFDRGNINLFAEIVNTSSQIIETRYPGSEFHMILWANKKDELSKKLEKKGIRVHYISDILTDYPEKQAKYLIKNDGHPNSLANKIIAEYVVNKIIRR